MKKILSFILIIYVCTLNSQNYDLNTIVPNSPSTAKFEKIFTPKVSEFKGILNLSIPIYEIKVDEITVPILLKYDSSGIKVDEEASWVGQSWSILSGGMITRNQVGIPDEMNKNYGFVPSVSYIENPLAYLPGQPEYISSFCYTPQLYEESGWFFSNSKIKNIVGLVETGTSPYSSSIYENYVRGVDYGANDSSPDIFNVFLPNGGYEKFFFKDRNEICFFDKSNSKINYNLPSSDIGIDRFEVKDSKGTFYEFKDIELLRHHKNAFITNSKTPDTFVVSEELLYSSPINETTERGAAYSFSNIFGKFVCSTSGSAEAVKTMDRLWPKAWHISKVKSVKGKEIKFKYETDTIYSLSKPIYRHSPFAGVTNEVVKVQNSLQKIAYPRLVEILWDEGRIEFISDDDRQDVYSNGSLGINSNKKRLDRIIIYNQKDKIAEYKLEHSYKNAVGYNNNLPIHQKSIYKRLFLDKVLVNNKKGQVIKNYSFNYNKLQLPNKFSSKVDYWGYFNNKKQGDFFPTLWNYPGEQRDFIDKTLSSLYPREIYVGEEKYDNRRLSDRRPDFNYSKAGLLEKVTYPTGGELSIEYEQNDFLWRGKAVEGPGLRIKKTVLREKQSDEKPIVTEYKYTENGITTGRIRTLPIFQGLARYYSISNPQPNYYKSSEPLNNFNYSFNNDFGYKKVEKIYSEGRAGKEVKTFSFPVKLGDISFVDRGRTFYETSAIKITATIDYVNSYPGNTTNTTDYYPYPPETNFSFATGKPLSKKTFNKDGGLLSEKKYSYEYNSSYDVVKSYFSDLGRFTSIRYLSSEHQLVEENKKEFFNNEIIEKNNIFKYNDNFQLSEIITTDSSGDIIKKKIKYPKDFAKEKRTFVFPSFKTKRNIYAEMVNKNMIDYPIETIKFNKGSVISSEVNSFKKSWENFVPAKFSKLNKKTLSNAYTELSSDLYGLLLNDNYTDKIFYDYYDNKGNLVIYHDKSEIYTMIIWGYNQTKPIAKIENIPYNEDLLYTYFLIDHYFYNENGVHLDQLSRLDMKVVSEDSLRTWLDKLRDVIKLHFKNMRLSTYTYAPLIGVTSIKNSRGEITYYEYDKLNRLKSVKDSDKNILKEIKYNYKK